MLLGCVYSWLTIATTTDARLLTNSASSPLPIIQAEVPIAGFYWAAPLILFGFYVYLHFYLQRLWEGLAKLPAVFPDGKPLHEKAYPWLLNGLVRAHFQRLRADRTLLSRLENIVSIALAFWVVPFTLFLFWGRYIPRHEWWGTGLHIALLVFSAGAAIMLHRHAVRTLRRVPTAFNWRKPWLDTRTYQGAIALVFGVVVLGFSYGSIDGVRTDERKITDLTTWVPHVFRLIGYRAFASLREADVSTKPDNWWAVNTTEDELKGIKGASLRGSNLNYADAVEAFLVKADLRNANLKGANLGRANLQGADLTGAKLPGANLSNAKLQGAILIGADLRGAGLFFTNLQGADLGNVRLQGADLYGANFSDADLTVADLSEVEQEYLRESSIERRLAWAELGPARPQEADPGTINFQNANLFGAKLEGADLRGANFKDSDLRGAKLQGALLRFAKLQGAQLILANLRGADLYKADLQNSNLTGANLSGTRLTDAKYLMQQQLDEACGDENTKLPEGLTIKPCSKERQLRDGGGNAQPKRPEAAGGG